MKRLLKVQNTEIRNMRLLTEEVLPVAVLLLGAVLRLVLLGKAPAGMHQDEAFSAWTAYSLWSDGIDSAGNFLPVYLAGWGDGQSALYSWLMIPLYAISGGKFSPFLSRFPQAFIAILSIAAVYVMLKKMFGKSLALWGEFLLAICPWHITMSRWGLEANLAPAFLIFGLCFFVLGIDNNRYLILSALAYGLSLYCYATIWPIVPIILLMQIVYCAIYRKITLNRYSIISALLLLIMAAPLMAFVIINTFNLSAIELPFMTIPIMSGFRGGEVALSLSQMWDNLKRVGHLLIFQNVGTPYDILLPYGLFYDIGRLFIVIGIICLIVNMIRHILRREFCHEFLIFAQLFGAGINCLLITANLQQVNSLYIPLVICEAYGVYSVIKLLGRLGSGVSKTASVLTVCVYMLYLVFFQKAYYTDYMELVNAYFAQGVRECVEYAMDASASIAGSETGISAPSIVVERGAQWPRLLLFSHITAPEYLANVTYKENMVEPASFKIGDTTFINGIDYDNIDASAIYIIYYPDVADFQDSYDIIGFYDWYVAVPKEYNYLPD
jgi:hypothetical protein